MGYNPTETAGRRSDRQAATEPPQAGHPDRGNNPLTPPPRLRHPSTVRPGFHHEHDREHAARHAFVDYHPRVREGVTVHSRRSMLKASLAGLAGLSLPRLLQARATAASAGQSIGRNKSVILLWMTGGPSHIDTWDVKPNAPQEIRGPFKDIPTRLPGVHICEHLPKQAAMLDKFTLIRSVDARESNHEPNQVFQTGNLEAEPPHRSRPIHFRRV